MDKGNVARIEDWEDAPFSGGYASLSDLADAEFTGAVTARGAWLFMLNGRVVGIADGSMSTFEGASGTAYEAPHPALPLLFAMQDKGGETEATYYTDDTPLSEVDATLSEGKFTGYVELSENVLSGDYYLVYYGGRSLSVAFVGNAEQLVVDEEALELASDEVGIYEVRSVDLDVRDVPEADDAAAGSEPTPTAPSHDADPSEPDSSEPEKQPPAADAEEETGEGEDGDTPSPHIEEAEGARADDDPLGGQDDRPQQEPGPDPGDVGAESVESEDSPTPSRPTPSEERPTGGSDPRPVENEAASGDPFSEEEAWRETRTIPSLDPEESGAEGNTGVDGVADDRVGGQHSTLEPSQEGVTDAREEELRRAIEAKEKRIAELEEQLEETVEERDQREEERTRLRSRVEELESRLESVGSATGEGQRLDPTEALATTDLFVRYGSKGKATLERAHDGEATKADVTGNLRLEEHTRFDADAAAVDGKPFQEFLDSSLEYRFVNWLVEDLLFEIQDTGNQGGLRDLFDALPKIDRVAFADAITTRDDEGQEISQTFDVVCRDRMGQPLLVADLNDARDPATGEMMGELIQRASSIAAGVDTVTAAFLVTASFFEPDALETAAESTGSGLLNRDSRKSFVKLSRKRGFHLCLVEARRGAFHVAVPEL